MINLKHLFTVLVVAISFHSKAQDVKFVNNGFNYYLGVGLAGPKFTTGLSSNDRLYQELSVYYHLFEFSKQEDLINKPSSGGWYIGYDYFMNMFSASKFKYFLGTGYGEYHEESGENTGLNEQGKHSTVDLHGGVRFLPTKRISVNLWVGYPIYTNRSNSIATKLEIEDDITIYSGSLDLIFRINK
jgi:hypothetical protein